MDDNIWRRAERPILWAALVVALGWTLWPAGEWLYGWSTQRALAAEWRAAQNDHKEHTSNAPNNGAEKSASAHSLTSASGRGTSTPIKEKWPPTRLMCSKIGLDAVVVEGVTPKALKWGPGHDPASALPGRGNCVIAAHRNAYGWWFRRLDSLDSGDIIVLETPESRFIYRVATRQVLNDDDTGVLAQPQVSSLPRLTLYSCTLPKSERRVVVTAVLE
jgi:LPXTG-site transpeptidase (sortase) family protein